MESAMGCRYKMVSGGKMDTSEMIREDVDSWEAVMFYTIQHLRK